MQVTLSATNGTVSLSGTAGLTFTAGDGFADPTMTFTGAVASNNTALNGLSYTPASGYAGAATLTITTNDQGNTGSGGALSDTDTVAITVIGKPSAPLNLVATPGPGGGQITLTWQAPASTGGSAVTGYRIHRGTVSGGETFFVQVGLTLTYVDSGMANGVTRFYQVSAVNVAGEGPKSNEATAATITEPGPPGNLRVQPGTALGEMTLMWDAPAITGSAPITGYRIYRGSASSGEVFLAQVGNQLTYTDSGLQLLRNYYYRVSAVNVVEGPMSNEGCNKPYLWIGALGCFVI